MKISRHARNNMRLYGISEKNILNTVESPDLADKKDGKTTAIKKFKGKFSGFPLKVVYKKTVKELFVVTAYPIKKKTWR